MMGDGVVDVASLRQAVDAAGYRGFIETESFARHLWDQPEPEVLRVCAERMTTVC